MSPEETQAPDLDVLIRTGVSDPIAIQLIKCLLEEAGIPFFAMDRSVAARQESGNIIGWLNIRVPKESEAEAREIVQNVEQSAATPAPDPAA